MVERQPESGLREVVHQRVRLGVLAVLERQGPCTFSQLRDALGQSDGALSRHLGVLEDHGFIATEKVFENRRPRTWVSLTAAGAEAFGEEQELLGKLLDRATAHTDAEVDADRERTAAMTIVFAALLAGEDSEAPPGGRERSRGGYTDRSRLVPSSPVLAGRRVAPIASGPVSARYELPESYTDFGAEQREQRLMMVSHGLRGGWITTWRDGDHRDGDLTAHALVVELGAADNCEAILAAMSRPTVELPAVPGARGYLLPAGEHGSPAPAVAWLSTGPFLASVSVIAPGEVAAALADLVGEVHAALASAQP